MEGPWLRFALRVWAVGILLFLFIPIGLVIISAFNVSTIQSWPIPGVTLRWFGQTWQEPQVRRALLLSVEAGLLATAVALVLGSMAAFAIHRFQFFGREVISFALVLPLALPGIITGMSLNSFFAFNQITFSLWTIVIGHATFCIVIVYNNVLARLRRTSSSLMEAAMDLGASGWRSFVDVTWPVLSTALVAGALLAFALSFDEVIVTTFTAGAQNTLPLWILGAIRLGQQLPLVNVVVFAVLALTLIPVVVAQRLTRDTGVRAATVGGT